MPDDGLARDEGEIDFSIHVVEPMAVAMPERCPKCGYARPAADTSPIWQCPQCRIAYIGYESGLSAPMQSAKPNASPFFLGLEFDRSAWALLATNLFAIGVSYATGMGLDEMLFVYWMQSVIIGVCAVIRILNLNSFTTRGWNTTSGPVEETPAAKRKTAIVFTLFYGSVHVGYLLFLYFGGPSIDPIQDSLLGYGLCAAVFAVNHAYSLYQNIQADAEGRPNLLDLAMLPFVRIVPMHFTVVVGNAMASGIAATVFFLFFKTLTDLLLHCIEHSALRRRRPGEIYVS